jgi:hypothetical protein
MMGKGIGYMPTGSVIRICITGKDGIAMLAILDCILIKILRSGVENVKTIT